MVTRTRALLASLLLLVATAGAAPVLATGVRTTVDDDHALATEHKQADFVQQGYATADLTAPSMSVTVADSHEDPGCELDGVYSDTRNDFLCIRYDEEIDRTLRLYIPAEYWTPYVRTDVEPITGGVPAAYEPVENSQYTAVTVELTEPGTYAWPVTKEASLWASAKERTLENIENVTGVGVPSTDEWRYISQSELGGNQSAYVVRAPNGTDALVLEYKTGREEWAEVPAEPRSYAPVYYETKQGVDDRAYVFATTDNPPEVRYKTTAGPTDQIGAALRQIGQIPNRLEEIFNIDIPFVGD